MLTSLLAKITFGTTWGKHRANTLTASSFGSDNLATSTPMRESLLSPAFESNACRKDTDMRLCARGVWAWLTALGILLVDETISSISVAVLSLGWKSNLSFSSSFSVLLLSEELGTGWPFCYPTSSTCAQRVGGCTVLVLRYWVESVWSSLVWQ